MWEARRRIYILNRQSGANYSNNDLFYNKSLNIISAGVVPLRDII